MGIFHSENRDHYSWVTCKAQLQQPGEHFDALVKWILCFSEGLQGNADVWNEKLPSKSWVLSHIPALLRNVQLSCISRSLVAWLVWVCGWMRCRAPWCSWVLVSVTAGLHKGKAALLPFLPFIPQLLAVAVWIFLCCWWEGLRNETQQVVGLLLAAHLLSLAGTRKTVFKQNT